MSHLDRRRPRRAARTVAGAGVFPMRIGTAFWHGDKSALHLGANVLDVRPVASGTVAGYRGAPVDGDGTLVIIGAGTAHGVDPLDDGRSPFHYLRRASRNSLERPHMHTSIVFVPAGRPCPRSATSSTCNGR